MSKRLICPICKGSQLKILQNKYKLDKFKKLFTLKKCKKCDHVFIRNKPSGKELKEYYTNETLPSKYKK